MELSHIIVLALVQGISEFLPVSSSAHLVLVPKLLGWADQGLAFDVAVHVGTLVAILIYFKDRIAALLRDFFASIAQKKAVGQSTLVWATGFGTIPVGLFGLAFGDFIEQYARNGALIAIMTIVFGLILGFADKKSGAKDETDITVKIALIIGLAQAIALIPGVSRSGVTMTAALMLGFSRTASANFSFVLAGGLEALKVFKMPDSLPWSDLAIGAAISGVSAYLCVRLFMAMLQRISMMPFVIYRLVLGVFLLLTFL